jgi:phosphoribosylformylglycinamidine (FGAM) synthase-like enzyme
VLEVCRHWGVDATAIGEVTDGDRLSFVRHGEVVHDAPARALADEGPVYERRVEGWTHPDAAEDVDRWDPPDDLHAAVLAVLTSPNVASARWIWEQYDSIVGHGTVQGPGGDAAVLRLRPDGVRGVAVATDGNGRWCVLDPRAGARLVVAEAARNVACTGAVPVAATNCLNFGSPERPEIMGQFRDAVDGSGDGAENADARRQRRAPDRRERAAARDRLEYDEVFERSAEAIRKIASGARRRTRDRGRPPARASSAAVETGYASAKARNSGARFLSFLIG